MDSDKKCLLELTKWIFSKRLKRVLVYEKRKSFWDDIIRKLKYYGIPCFSQYNDTNKLGIYFSVGDDLFQGAFDGYCFLDKAEFEMNDIIEQTKKYNTLILPQNEQIKKTVEKDKAKKFKFPAEKRILKDQEIREMFVQALKYAENEIDIVSPWVNRTAVNDEIMGLMKEALERGVLIKIVYGISASKKEKPYDRTIKSDETIEYMQEQFASFGELFRVNKQNTHFKLLICDKTFYVTGSFNFLSFDGNYEKNDTREEGCEYNTDKDTLTDYIKDNFNF